MASAEDSIEQRILCVQAKIREVEQQLANPPEGFNVEELQRRLNILEQKELALLQQQSGVY